jgi:hypothetical protein
MSRSALSVAVPDQIVERRPKVLYFVAEDERRVLGDRSQAVGGTANRL